MILRAKILLLWLLALAIPVQGFAAVLQACAPAMVHGAAPAQPAMQQQGHEHHAGHDMQAMQAMQADDAAPAHDASHHAQHNNASCSYCAACTTGAVFPLALNAPPAPDLPSREFIAPPASGFVGYLPENPDRPPALI
ncbi:DUF2946 family protein [Herbaspirillum sp. WKF16]|jgi:hypothetical protein|uniref:DUF2946 family protein n=1 Tax=Herbaspirillum sp. WKF16 TaxID=3028312 RepID=UPI0023A9A3B9|nr:DUF2946 family protein [Herbaspirillum sp. WKF16]WDZ94803.1 DUF2946 family protein [Herbaspirillum sp. WKF16]